MNQNSFTSSSLIMPILQMNYAYCYSIKLWLNVIITCCIIYMYIAITRSFNA